MGKLFYYACAAAVACIATFAAPAYADTHTDGGVLVDDRLLYLVDLQPAEPSPFLVIAIEALPDARPEPRIEKVQRDRHARPLAAINPPARRPIGSAPGWLHAPPG